MLRQEEEEEGMRIGSKNNNRNDYDFDFTNIFSTASLWLTGGRRPTLYLPIELAKKYRMDRPCRVAFSTHKDGILVSFVCSKKSDKLR